MSCHRIGWGGYNSEINYFTKLIKIEETIMCPKVKEEKIGDKKFCIFGLTKVRERTRESVFKFDFLCCLFKNMKLFYKTNQNALLSIQTFNLFIFV